LYFQNRRRNELIRPSVRIFGACALVLFSIPALRAAAQQQVPPAPAQEPSAPTPSAPAAAPQPPALPKPDPANFTASSPTVDTVNAFLKASWGYDDNRVWQVEGIFKTSVDGVSKVIIYAADRGGKEKPGSMGFYVLPDGKHIIAGDLLIPFGANPFADYRTQLQQHADGPYRGSAAKDLELVEFADFQCPHCKDAQANMEKLVADYPKARIVFQNYPLVNLHPQAMAAATFGVCVAKEGGSTAFFTYASAVFDGQDGLSSADGASLTLNSAVTKAGLDPAKIKACADTPDVSKSVAASVKLAQDLNVNQTPTLVVNGRQVPANAPYETLKQVIDYQSKLDGIAQ
jgi:protein-disulfide isomerase